VAERLAGATAGKVVNPGISSPDELVFISNAPPNDFSFAVAPSSAPTR
jgi:hypothetical protein